MLWVPSARGASPARSFLMTPVTLPFTRVVEQLEEGAKMVGELVNEGSRDLLARVSKRVFSHLF